jgi:FkbM family methyltransferase
VNLDQLSYHPTLNRVIRAFGLRSLARKAYFAIYKDIETTITCGGLKAKFRTADPRELRTVRGAAAGETKLLESLLSELRTEDVFLDVGANLGLFSVFAAQKCRQVISCEPEAIATERLRTNIQLNQLQNIVVVEAALTDQEGAGFISTPASDKSIQDSRLASSGQPVRLMRGDVLPYLPTVVKIDVEGHEVSVLAGMNKLLSHVRLLFCEIHAGVNPDDIEGLLLRCGRWRFTRLDRHEQIHLIAVRS